MSYRNVVFLVLGYSVGSFPDHGPVWLGIHLAFTVAVFILAFRILRRDTQRRDS